MLGFGSSIFSGTWLKSLNPNLKSYPSDPIFKKTSIYATWDYVDAGQTMDEMVFVGAFMVLGMILTNLPAAKTFNAKYKKNAIDYLITLSMIFSLSVMVVSKFQSGLPEDSTTYFRAFFLIVPCHVVTSLDLYAQLYHSKLSQSINDVMIWYKTAIATPDTSDYKYKTEIFAFWLQHFIMVVAPIWNIVSGRYVLAPYSIKPHIFIVCACVVHSLNICLPVSILTGLNINYMTLPPKPLLKFGPHFRKIVGIAEIFLSVATRILIGLLIYVIISIKNVVFSTGSNKKKKSNNKEETIEIGNNSNNNNVELRRSTRLSKSPSTREKKNK